MFKVEIEYETEDDHSNVMKVLVKMAPVEESFKKSCMNFHKKFGVEIEFYAKIIPKLEQLLAGLSDSSPISPKCIYHSLEPHPIMIFEDITARGYSLPGGLLDFENTKRVLTKLAKFHAASMVLHQVSLKTGFKFFSIELTYINETT